MLRLLQFTAMAIGVWLALSYLGPSAKYEQLISAGVSTQGTVVRQDCHNHGSFIYRFEVDGRHIESSDKSSSIGRRCDELAMGESIKVTYLPTDSTVSMVGSPQAQLRNERQAIGLAALVVPAFVVWRMAKRRREQGDA